MKNKLPLHKRIRLKAKWEDNTPHQLTADQKTIIIYDYFEYTVTDSNNKRKPYSLNGVRFVSISRFSNNKLDVMKMEVPYDNFLIMLNKYNYEIY